ncbi:MAG: class I SAM-dependent methyltransferase [Nitrospirae bacterium]|nr:class I SAM-dependent methyltransferase [Nitrospirota bacterium]
MGLRYDYTVDASNTKTVYARILSWATPGGRVLDVGCDTGNLASCLAGLGMKAEGVEMDAEAAKKAGERLENVYVGSIEDEAVLGRLSGQYDMIIFADVLEHLAYPEVTIKRMKALLSDGGVIVASLPNVANFRVRFGLLFGRFDYTETGILDRTHLRFFTRKTAPELFRKAGFNVLDVKPAATFMPWPLLLIWPELFATRFVIKAGL